MRVCFLLNELGASGGVGVLVGHAERLAAHSIEAEFVITGRADDVAREPAVPVLGLAAARDRTYDFAIATWWETAAALWQVDATRRAVFLQSLEERFYGERELLERLGAASVLALPVDYVTIGGWMRDVLADLRPDARCVVVRNGIDKAVFRPPPERRGSGDGPLRVLVEGNPEMWLKGVPDAVAAVEAMTEPVELTRAAGGLDAAGMAALYADHDVLLKLSRVEGVALPPIEAMHVGTPCVVTPHTGHDEYVRHRENGLVVGFDDVGAATAALDLLARDRALLARLSQGALQTAADWSSAEDSTAALAAALRELAAAPPPEVASAMAALAARQRLAIELGRGQLGELEWHERAYHELLRQMGKIRGERAYKAAARARGLVHRVTGR